MPTALLLGGSYLSAQATVPFIGCKSGGQISPAPPQGPPMSIEASHGVAQSLAYYALTKNFGVLGPSDWHCFGTHGSGGYHLFVTQEPIDKTKLFSSEWQGLTGPAIQLSWRTGQTSGRFDVAAIILLLFPTFKAWAQDVSHELPELPIEIGPYPGDKLAYLNPATVEYETPALTKGVGTLFSVRENKSAIKGVVILDTVEHPPDVFVLSVRLPLEQAHLTRIIIQQVERESSRIRH